MLCLINYLIPRLLTIHQFSATINEMIGCYTEVTLQTYISSAYIIIMKNKMAKTYIHIPNHYNWNSEADMTKGCLFD